MQDFIIVTGMILKQTPIGEYDRRICLLTKERGKIAAFVKGSRKPGNRLSSAANPFSFGAFKLYEGKSSYNVADNGVRCVQVDGGGRPLGEVRALPFARLSYDCQPVYLDGAVSWYVNAMGGRLLYSVSP